MNRDLQALTSNVFDVLVVGGGIHGAITAWDAALRGLSVALIDRGDFGGATSQNSLKIIHGGLRYLKDGNIGRIRAMARERATWMRIAPHLVHPLTCLTPTDTKFSSSGMAMRAALGLNDLLSFDRNRSFRADQAIPAGRMIGREECAQMLPGLDVSRLTGAAVWHDAQVYNTERLLFSFVISASRAGAVPANYMEATGVCRGSPQREASVQGVRARDLQTGEELLIRARVVVNSAGAWVDQLLGSLEQPDLAPRYLPSVALNLVTRQIWAGCAAGLRGWAVTRDGSGQITNHSHMFFLAPWQDHTLIGTWHIPWPHDPGSFRVTRDMIEDFLAAVNTAHRGLALSMEDVQHVQWGFLPVTQAGGQGGRVRLVREGLVIDHQEEDGVGGLISIVGVKYTTARAVAQQAVDLAVRKLGRNELRCQTHEVPVAGGDVGDLTDFTAAARASSPANLDPDTVRHLASTYGSEVKSVLEILRGQPELAVRVDPGSPVLKAEIVRAAREEMVQTLADVVRRRTDLGAAGLPPLPAIQVCADLASEALGWDPLRRAREIEETIQDYPAFARVKEAG